MKIEVNGFEVKLGMPLIPEVLVKHGIKKVGLIHKALAGQTLPPDKISYIARNPLIKLSGKLDVLANHSWFYFGVDGLEEIFVDVTNPHLLKNNFTELYGTPLENKDSLYWADECGYIMLAKNFGRGFHIGKVEAEKEEGVAREEVINGIKEGLDLITQHCASQFRKWMKDESIKDLRDEMSPWNAIQMINVMECVLSNEYLAEEERDPFFLVLLDGLKGDGTNHFDKFFQSYAKIKNVSERVQKQKRDVVEYLTGFPAAIWSMPAESFIALMNVSCYGVVAVCFGDRSREAEYSRAVEQLRSAFAEANEFMKLMMQKSD